MWQRKALLDEIDDVLRGGAGKKNSRNAGLFESGDVGFRDDAADKDCDIVHTLFVEELHELRAEGIVSTGKDGEANDVDVFLDSGGGNHLRGLPQASVDHFHASVSQGAGDDLCAAVVAIKTGLGD